MYNANYLIGNLEQQRREELELIYSTEKVEEQCNSVKAAKKLTHIHLKTAVTHKATAVC